ncbi:hypothetical protein B296_00028729 [Ensete ventricosum]|nr:hypothetical protein B296_00028729 [Ensete ventricosum]
MIFPGAGLVKDGPHHLHVVGASFPEGGGDGANPRTHCSLFKCCVFRNAESGFPILEDCFVQFEWQKGGAFTDHLMIDDSA